MISEEISWTYPYERVMDGAVQLSGAEEIPRRVLDYLMDLPLPGYTPPDDNRYPRCRLMKYLYYDEANPLAMPAPTTAQKLALRYDPQNPTKPPTDKGYRIFAQSNVEQAQLNAQSTLRVYMGRMIGATANRLELSVIFEILSSAVSESNAAALSRTWAMECAIFDALNGVNLTGVGGFYCVRGVHGDGGSVPIGDRRINVGRSLCMGLTWMG